MAHEKSVTAILVAYNSAGVIAKALEALATPEIASIIVVDNCSSDATCDLIKEKFPQVKLIENPRNDGFGRGNNIGLAKVQTPYALLVNPDAMLEEGALSTLLASAEAHPDAAILAPALYNEKGELHVSYKRNVWEREKNSSPPPEDEIEYLSGAVWLLNMKLMKQVGFFDPNIFLYYEDDDLCLRTIRAGYRLRYVPSARVMHLMGASSGEVKPESEFFRQKHMAWSRLYMEGKYRGEKAARWLAARQNVLFSLKAAFYFFLMNARRTARYRGRLQGVFAYLEKLPLK